MRFTLILSTLFVIAAAPKAPWPETPAGAVARQYVEAFASEDAMRAFLVRNVDEQNLRERPIDARIDAYRESKKKFKTLKFGSIVSSKPEELKVTLIASDGAKHQFTFTVSPTPPHKLVSITRMEIQRHGHGLGLFPGH